MEKSGLRFCFDLDGGERLSGDDSIDRAGKFRLVCLVSSWLGELKNGSSCKIIILDTSSSG